MDECRTCHWFIEHSTSSGDPDDMKRFGNCHKRAPAGYLTHELAPGEKPSLYVFPWVVITDGCGAYKMRQRG